MTIQVTLPPNPITEPVETAVVTIMSNTACQVGSPGSDTVTISGP